MRQRAPKPHERSVSSLHDTEGHGRMPATPGKASDRPWMVLPLLPRDAAARETEDPSPFKTPRHAATSLPNSPRRAMLRQERPAYDNLGTPVFEAASVFGTHAGPEQVVYRSYSRPSNRTEAIQLAEALEQQLEATKHDVRGSEHCWAGTFRELVRQVYVHCAERGELLERVRAWHEEELKRLHTAERKAREREKRLKEQLRAGGGHGGASGGFGLGAGGHGHGGGSQAQRIEMLRGMIGVAGGAGMGSLLAEAVETLRTEHEDAGPAVVHGCSERIPGVTFSAGSGLAFSRRGYAIVDRALDLLRARLVE